MEPTNNGAERAIRPAVIRRRTSFGSQTLAGITFVARMWTVVTTLKSQQRHIWEFITTAVGMIVKVNLLLVCSHKSHAREHKTCMFNRAFYS